MTAARIVLALVVVSTGLVLYIIGMFQPLLSQLSGAEFTVVMDRFLPAARKNFLNYLFTLTSLLAPILVLILLRDHTDSAMFWLTLAGWPAFFAGPILGSRFVAALAQPTPQARLPMMDRYLLVLAPTRRRPSVFASLPYRIASDHQAVASRFRASSNSVDRCVLRRSPVQRVRIVVPATRLAISPIQCEVPLASVAVPERRTGNDPSAHDLNSREH